MKTWFTTSVWPIVLSILLTPAVIVAEDASPVTEDPTLLGLPEDPVFPDQVDLPSIDPTLLENIPGRTEGIGTTFEVTDSEYLNVSLVSTVPVQVTLESIPEMITMHIEAADTAHSAQITMSGLAPATTYYKYTDDYHNLEVLLTDANGTFVYTQDLSEPHTVFVQPIHSTIFLSDTGWSVPGVGTWDAATLTATLTTDITETIQIDSDGITLDGGGHILTGSGTGYGILLSNRAGVTIKNVTVSGFTVGVSFRDSSNNTLLNNTASNCGSGFGIGGADSINNTVSNNVASNNNYDGIGISYTNGTSMVGNIISDNIVSGTNQRGIRIERSSNNTIAGNTITNSLEALRIRDYSNNNTIKGNMVSSNGTGMNIYRSSSLTIEDNIIENSAGDGIVLIGTTNNSLTNNTISSSGNYGIDVYDASNNDLSDNLATNNKYGIVLDEASFDNMLTSNTTNNNLQSGIYIAVYSSANVLANNNAVGNGRSGISVAGAENILTGNLASYNAFAGIHLGDTPSIAGEHNTVTGTTATNNETGIWLASSNSLASANTVFGNTYGIVLWGSHGSRKVTVRNNTAMWNDYGLYFNYYADDNTLYSNLIMNNSYGMGIFRSSDNEFYNNDVIDNVMQVRAAAVGDNIFNRPAPIGGNYWSDHTGPDANGDGFIDYPYTAYNNLPWGGARAGLSATNYSVWRRCG